MELQHVNVKLRVDATAPIDLGPVIPVFHGWIQDRTCEEILVDVADYRHVPAGPGIVLVGHEANYSLDNADNRLGIRYNRKAALDAAPWQTLAQAARAALLACRRLASDPRLQGKIRFDGRRWEIFVNDRMLAPNGEEMRAALEPELRVFLDRLFAARPYTLQFDTDPRRLLTAFVESADAFTPDDLLKNLDS